jgi:hypothetical protein
MAFTASGDFGAGTFTSAGMHDIALTALDMTDGSVQWSRRFGGPGVEYPWMFHAGPGGDVWMCGEASSGIDFGGGVLANAGNRDAYVVRFGADGSHQFSRSFGGPGLDACEGIGLGPGGRVYLSGSFTAAGTWDGRPVPFGGGPWDGYVLALDSDGTISWIVPFGAGSSDDATDLAGGPGGGPIITGWFGATIDLGARSLSSRGQLDTILAELSPEGDVLWAMPLGETREETGSAVRTDGDAIVVFGGFDGPTSLGGSMLPFVGVYDVFLTRYAR